MFNKTIFFLIAFFILEQSFAQNFHVFSVVLTNEKARPDRTIDADRINNLSNLIASYTGFTRYYYDFGDYRLFNSNILKQTIQKLKFTNCNKDLVWLHFSGYGRNDEESIYPALQMGESESYLRDIIGLIRQKRPKTILISIDSGNEVKPPSEFSNQFSDRPRSFEHTVSKVKIIKPEITNPIPKQMGLFHQLENYNTLFKSFEGTIVLIFQSNSFGENAFSNVVDGSYGLFYLEKAIKEAIMDEKHKADWMKIKENYIKNVQLKTKNRQNPKVTIEVPLDNCKEDE